MFANICICEVANIHSRVANDLRHVSQNTCLTSTAGARPPSARGSLETTPSCDNKKSLRTSDTPDYTQSVDPLIKGRMVPTETMAKTKPNGNTKSLTGHVFPRRKATSDSVGCSGGSVCGPMGGMARISFINPSGISVSTLPFCTPNKSICQHNSTN
jgi:hypothetical protein